MTETGHQFADLHTLPEKGLVLAAYLELHVEQGPLLERQGVPIGVVTDTVGIEHGTFHFTGRANHAGTTPMDMRQDAALGVARGIAEARRLAIEDELRATSGRLSASPDASNVIPGSGSFSLDARHQSNAVLDGYLEALTGSCQQIAHQEDLDFAYEHSYRLDPVPLGNDARAQVAAACAAAGAEQTPILSGAGHDAMVLAPRPSTGMLIVPSRDGISHAPAEYSSREQCTIGAQVLTLALSCLTG